MKKNIEKTPQLIQEDLVVSVSIGTTSFLTRRISTESREELRNWHGHPEEEKIILCLSGLVRVLMVKPDNWHNPSLNLKVMEQVLKAGHSDKLLIPAGYVTAIQPISNDGLALEFSTVTKEEFQTNGKVFPKEWWYVETFM